jgi:hypothetical protein
VQLVFDELDFIYASGNNEVQTLVTVGFLEDFQNLASQQECGVESFVRFLSPRLLLEWNALNAFWSGQTTIIP